MAVGEALLGVALFLAIHRGAPVANAATVGQQVDTPIVASLSGSVYGWDVTLSYDPSILSVSAVDLGTWTQLNTCGLACTPGTLRLAGYSTTPCTGSCLLFTVTWNTIKPGTSQIQITKSQLAGRENGVFSGSLNATLNGTAITVDSPTPTPLPSTPTPTAVPPTASPTATATSTPTSTPTASRLCYISDDGGATIVRMPCP